MLGIVSVKYNASKYFFALLIHLMKVLLFGLLLSLEEAKEELLSCSLNYWEQSIEVKVTFCVFEEASCSRLWLKTNSLLEKKMFYVFIVPGSTVQDRRMAEAWNHKRTQAAHSCELRCGGRCGDLSRPASPSSQFRGVCAGRAVTSLARCVW